MFLTYAVSGRHNISKTVCTLFVLELGKQENIRLVIYKSSFTKGRKMCNWRKFRPLSVSLLAFNAKLSALDKLCT